MIRLAQLCERASAPPAALYAMFTRYDADGSGKIAYDEIIEMVKDTGTEVEGRDMASEFLDKYSEGEGELTYDSFIVRVLELQPDALQKGPTRGPKRVTTAERIEEVSDAIKQNIQSDPSAIQRVFRTFDKTGCGEIRLAEFVDSVKTLSLPIQRKQIKRMFMDLDVSGNGSLDVDEFTRDVLRVTVADDKSPTTISTSPPLRTGRVSASVSPVSGRSISPDQRKHTTRSLSSGNPVSSRWSSCSPTRRSQRSPPPSARFSLTKLRL